MVICVNTDTHLPSLLHVHVHVYLYILGNICKSYPVTVCVVMQALLSWLLHLHSCVNNGRHRSSLRFNYSNCGFFHFFLLPKKSCPNYKPTQCCKITFLESKLEYKLKMCKSNNNALARGHGVVVIKDQSLLCSGFSKKTYCTLHVQKQAVTNSDQLFLNLTPSPNFLCHVGNIICLYHPCIRSFTWTLTVLSYPGVQNITLLCEHNIIWSFAQDQWAHKKINQWAN